MNNTFDFDDIFADFPLSFPTASPSSDKEFSNLIPTYIDCCHEIFPQEQILNESILQIPEP